MSFLISIIISMLFRKRFSKQIPRTWQRKTISSGSGFFISLSVRLSVSTAVCLFVWMSISVMCSRWSTGRDVGSGLSCLFIQSKEGLVFGRQSWMSFLFIQRTHFSRDDTNSRYIIGAHNYFQYVLHEWEQHPTYRRLDQLAALEYGWGRDACHVTAPIVMCWHSYRTGVHPRTLSSSSPLPTSFLPLSPVSNDCYHRLYFPTFFSWLLFGLF